MTKRGFSLIEVLVTLSLVMLLAAATVEIISLSLSAKKKAEIHGELTRFLTDKLERLRSLPADDEALNPGDYREIVQTENGERSFIREWTIEDLPGEMKRIEIKISSRDRNRNTLSAMLLISKKLGFQP